MSSIGSPALIVATANLNLVHDVVRAIQTADVAVANAASSQAVTGVALPSPNFSSSNTSRIDAIIAGRHDLYTNKRSSPSAQTSAASQAPNRISPNFQSNAPSSPPSQTSLPIFEQKSVAPAIQPPWDVLPWPKVSPEPQRIKSGIVQPDILIKGLLIDLFV